MSRETYIDFRKEPARRTMEQWWGELESLRGDRAALRRCRSPTEVHFQPPYHRLSRRLAAHFPVRTEALACAAGLAAHVTVNDESVGFPVHLARAVEGKDRAPLSGLRFRRLLQVPDDDAAALYGPMVRALRLLGGRANLPDLAQSVYWWNERTKRTWASDYYEHAPGKEE